MRKSRSLLILLLTAMMLGGCHADHNVQPISRSTSSAHASPTPSALGPFSVQTYSRGIPLVKHAKYASPMIYYPTEATTPLPGVVFIPGNGDVYMESPELLTQWGKLFASYGVAMLFINPSDLVASPPERATVLLQAVNVLAAENTRAGSPLLGKLNPERIAVMGHSYGGAGALYAANANADARIKAAIGLNPVPTHGFYSAMRVPALILGGTGDPYTNNLRKQFNSIPDATPRMLAIFSETPDVTLNSMHLIAHSPLGAHKNDPAVANLVLAFLKVHLMQQRDFQRYLTEANGMDAFEYRPGTNQE